MSDEEKLLPTSEAKSEAIDLYDAALDFYSDKFDPLKALMSDKVVVPVPDAPVFDNISKYDSYTKGLKATVAKKQPKVPEPVFQRRFEEHQMPVRVERTVVKKKNLYQQMAAFEGPLVLLKKCVEEHIKIKVWTRYAWGIRGYCIAFIVAFDKHWNMALTDVTEIWSRKKKRKVPALDSLDTSQIPGSSKPRLRPPPITITKTTAKMEFCKRKIPQLLIRGEQVAMVHLLNTNASDHKKQDDVKVHDIKKSDIEQGDQKNVKADSKKFDKSRNKKSDHELSNKDSDSKEPGTSVSSVT